MAQYGQPLNVYDINKDSVYNMIVNYLTEDLN